MNYRHIYHAGNIGDVLKHITLSRLITYFQRKEKAFRILDTHAGVGMYDLTSTEAQKTQEWQNGAAKVYSAEKPNEIAELLAPWQNAVRAANETEDLLVYPGSPKIARHLLRKQDRLTLTELHTEDYQKLSQNFEGDHQVKTIHLDGWLAMGSFLPPKEKRGLVLVDPAFEELDEFRRMQTATLKAYKKWSSGTYALWYPLKDRKAIRTMHNAFEEAGFKDVIKIELSVGKSGPDTRMLGSGMTLINPPYTFETEMKQILPWLITTLGNGPNANWDFERLLEE